MHFYLVRFHSKWDKISLVQRRPRYRLRAVCYPKVRCGSSAASRSRRGGHIEEVGLRYHYAGASGDHQQSELLGTGAQPPCTGGLAYIAKFAKYGKLKLNPTRLSPTPSIVPKMRHQYGPTSQFPGACESLLSKNSLTVSYISALLSTPSLSASIRWNHFSASCGSRLYPLQNIW
jgi:hypothetical protein